MENAAAAAIRSGHLAALESFLAQNPAAVNARLDGQRTLLHVATDWPGHFPNVRQTIAALADRGADLNAPFLGQHAETPLHWAASSDDLEALDAVAFGCWHAANRLIERGARSNLWQSAALGRLDHVQEHFTRESKPSPQEVTNAFWNACRGGQLEAARFLLAQGATLNWIGHDHMTPLDTAVHNSRAEVVVWLRAEGAESAADSTE
jgi:uncharacterized protein